MKIFLLLLNAFCIEFGYSSDVKRLLLISLDGFRYDYMDLYEAPNLKSISQEGVNCPNGMIASFPTYTFPNHQTLVTGLYPESHGIVSNVMYDPDFKETFKYSNDSKWWADAVPIWITAKSKSLKTAVSFWPGSTVEYKGQTADYFSGYIHDQPFTPRADEMINWFVEKNVTFATIYFEQPDGEGHKYGPNSTEVKSMVKQMDDLVGHIKSKLTEHNLWEDMNVVILSDHGMSDVPKDEKHIFVLEDYLNADDYVTIPTKGAVTAILPEKEKTQIVYEKIKSALKNYSQFSVYLKENVPDKFHFRNNKRIMPIIIIAEEHYITAKYGTNYSDEAIGHHGYDNTLQNMRPIFLARGPSFKKKVSLDSFPNINIYSLLCHLLNVKPENNNGTLNIFKPILVDSSSNRSEFSFRLCIASLILMLKLNF